MNHNPQSFKTQNRSIFFGASRRIAKKQLRAIVPCIIQESKNLETGFKHSTKRKSRKQFCNMFNGKKHVL